MVVVVTGFLRGVAEVFFWMAVGTSFLVVLGSPEARVPVLLLTLVAILCCLIAGVASLV